MLDVQLLERIVSAADVTETTFRLRIGHDTADSGKEKPLFASFVVSGAHLTVSSVLDKLDKMGSAPVPLKLPAVKVGSKVELRLAPQYAARTLGKVLRELLSPAPAPAPTANGQSEPTPATASA